MAEAFRFSLLPKKTKEEVVKEESRANGLLYASILLFFIVVVWLSIALMNALFVKKSIEDWTKTSNQRDQQILGYSTYRNANGELVVKTNLLSGVVDKHLDPELVFGLIDRRIKESTPDVEIISYGRAAGGSFQVTGLTDDSDDISKLIKDFGNEDAVNTAQLVTTTKEAGKFRFLIDLEIDAAAE